MRAILVLLTISMLASAAPSFAAPVSIAIQNGTTSGTIGGQGVTYTYSLIHDASVAIGNYPGGTYYDGGIDLLTPISGTLTGDLTQSGTTLTLSGITGNLTSTLTSAGAVRFGGVTGGVETVQITGGSLMKDTVSQPNASGSLSYTLSGASTVTGTFYFNPVHYLDGAAPGPNGLSNNWLYLWGDNWQVNGNNRPTDGSALGLDLTGQITQGPLQPVPLPASVLLFGSGLTGLLVRIMWGRSPVSLCSSRP